MATTFSVTKIAQAEAYEAKIQAAQATVKQLSENVFSVPSSRKGVQPHIITTDENGNANYCTCEGFTYCKHCYHGIAVTRFVAAQKAVKAAEAIVAEAQQTPEQAQIESYVKQGVDPVTARRVVEACEKPVKASNAKANDPKPFSLFK